MKALQEMVLIGEIVLQSKIARRAADRLKATHDNFDQVEVWCSIQSILVAAGNVSKILWPSKKEYKTRRCGPRWRAGRGSPGTARSSRTRRSATAAGASPTGPCPA